MTNLEKIKSANVEELAKILCHGIHHECKDCNYYGNADHKCDIETSWYLTWMFKEASE